MRILKKYDFLKHIVLCFFVFSFHVKAMEKFHEVMPYQPKVFIITMFDGEVKPWLDSKKFTKKIPITGLSKQYPYVYCSTDSICVMTTAMGFSNAASSVSAVSLSDKFDLKDTYFIISGIGGVNPEYGTLGSAHWARYVIDGGLRHEIDPRQTPSHWASGSLSLGSNVPDGKPRWLAGTEVYQLNEKLLQKVYKLSLNVKLTDSQEAQIYRKKYKNTPGGAPPKVSICDTLSDDTYWHGSLIGASMQKHVSLITDNKANYCTTQMEDNATLTALQRSADAGRLRFDRIMVLRTGSNFDREAPNQDVRASLIAESGGFLPSVENAYLISKMVSNTIVNNWSEWKNNVP